ncbi:uncharacterized protein BXZ73DRAFT_74615 [Epithele typhae]|uniref:uncharacterized protein n=1 Tax=Epithele typhae TaxID=378194 RepID=UPI00200757B2|nr:uncharacterized protein BXZ73DRAFT_74615 [Epithele typhae]KAH9942339.1 hypothetical protein BXZ73DRAFT_74615 [Epithele typhae]
MSMTSEKKEQIQRAIMIASISGKPFEDLKIWAFSRRANTGIVDKPCALFANTTMMHKATDHFKYVARFGGLEAYDYESDSDLEDEDDEEDENLDEAIDWGVFTHDAILARVGVKVSETSTEAHKSDETPDGDKDGEPSQLNPKSDVAKVTKRPGRVIYVDDVACQTLKAFIFWAYYGELNFRSLKSIRKKPFARERRPELAETRVPRATRGRSPEHSGATTDGLEDT